MINDLIISQIRQRLEILYQMVDELEASGGGGDITVDQTYTPTSENAQSGKAVAEALETIPSVTAEDIASAITRETSTNWQVIVSGAAKIGDFVFLHLCFISTNSETISTNDTKIAKIANPYHPKTEPFVQCNGYDFDNNILPDVVFRFLQNGDIIMKHIGPSSITTGTFPQFSMSVMYKVST